MPNFFNDNDDIKFHFEHMSIGELAAIMEENFTLSSQFDNAPVDPVDAMANYKLILESLGEVAGDFIAQRTEGVDATGVKLNADGSVCLAPGTAEALDILAKAEVMEIGRAHV